MIALVIAVATADSGDSSDVEAAVGDDERQIVVGKIDRSDVEDPDEAGPVDPDDLEVDVEAGSRGIRLSPRAEPRPNAQMLAPDGAPPGPAIPFLSSRTGRQGLVFILVAGSDARPGESVTRSRADSIHVIAVNPSRGQGTIVGIPRDAYVDIPGRGRNKINSALSSGGPELLAAAVEQLTGFPIEYYVVTGFSGVEAMTEELGRVDVFVDRRMNDDASGARFERGWHNFKGNEVLAFARNRKDTALGDFSRSENHGVLMLAGLAKMRAEVGDEGGLSHWVTVLGRHATFDLPMGDLFELAVLARRLDPGAFDNVVASGTVGRSPGGASVVYLDDDATALFAEVRDDGIIGAGSVPDGAQPPPNSTTSTTTAPATTLPVPTSSAPSTSAPTATTSTTSTTTPGSTTSTTGPAPSTTIPPLTGGMGR